jgi:hypothetical protein
MQWHVVTGIHGYFPLVTTGLGRFSVGDFLHGPERPLCRMAHARTTLTACDDFVSKILCSSCCLLRRYVHGPWAAEP